jgi:hypothetical protein
MAGFIQVIEWKTSRIDEVKALNDEWRDRFPDNDSRPRRVVVCADRDQEGSYLTIVEFDSYEAAMKNNDDPATAGFAERMQALCDGPPTFHNLDVAMEETP